MYFSPPLFLSHLTFQINLLKVDYSSFLLVSEHLEPKMTVATVTYRLMASLFCLLVEKFFLWELELLALQIRVYSSSPSGSLSRACSQSPFLMWAPKLAAFCATLYEPGDPDVECTASEPKEAYRKLDCLLHSGR